MRKLVFFTAIMLATTLTMAACNTQPSQPKQATQTQQSDQKKEMESVSASLKSTPLTQDLAQNQEVTFTASDGGTVYADLHMSGQNSRATFIILFHQAGSNGRGEYASIIPKLKNKGYNLLVVDQRSGGGYFGNENRTVKVRGGKTKYCAAYPDMEAALAYAKTKSGGKVFAWGSSYSAALVLKLASEHAKDLAGVISFSPATGKSMGACNANNFIAGVNIPALGIRPDSEMGSDISKSGQAQRARYKAQGLDYYVAKDGVHGSSMLDPSRIKGRSKGDVEPTWQAVWAFLDKAKAQ